MLLSSDPKAGGGHQYATILAECLKELSTSHFELIALCVNRFWRNWCKNNGIRYRMIGEVSSKYMWLNFRFPVVCRMYNTYKTELGRSVKQEKIDVLFITTQDYFPSLNVKVIAPVHDLMHRYEPGFPEVSGGYEFREQMFKCQARYSDYLLTDSKMGKQQFIESYSDYIHRKHPYIVSLPFIVPQHIFEVEEEYINVPDKYVFYPAQFWKHKNHINLVRAIRILSDTVGDIHLVLAGTEKNCLQEIKKYIKENKLEKNVTILGFVSNGNITYLYKHAVALVMPSYFGPTNIPPLEAMALGCPVVVSKKYAMPEQVGEAGLLFNPDLPEEIAECIRQVWTDERLRQKMIKKGYQRINSWNKKHFKHRLLKVIESCLHND